MEMMLKKVLIIPVALFLMAGCLPKPRPRTGDFNAIVKDILTEQPIPGVSINIGGQSKETDHEGRFSLAGLAPGDYWVRMERSWYLTKEISYRHLGRPDLIEFYLQPEELLNGSIFYSLDSSKVDREIYQLDLRTRTYSKLMDLPDSDEVNPSWASSGMIAFQKGTDKNSIIELFYPVSCSITSFGAGEHPSLDKSGTIMVYKSGNNVITKEYLDKTKVPKTYQLAGFNPVISPDGKNIAYTRGTRKSLLIDLNGSEVEFVLDDDFKLDNPCWSPNGERIAFEAYQDSKGQRGIYWIQVLPTLSTKMQQLTIPSGPTEQHKHPTWDGSGKIIYFARSATYSSRSEIYGVKFSEDQTGQGMDQWIMVSQGSGSKDYPCWGE